MGLARYPVCFGEQQLNAVQPHFKRLSSILFFWLLRSTLPLTPEFCKRLKRRAIKLLAEEPEGLGYSILIERLAAALPDIPVNTIRGSVVGLLAHKPDEVYKPAKGLVQHTMYGNGLEVVSECVDPVKAK